MQTEVVELVKALLLGEARRLAIRWFLFQKQVLEEQIARV